MTYLIQHFTSQSWRGNSENTYPYDYIGDKIAFRKRGYLFQQMYGTIPITMYREDEARMYGACTDIIRFKNILILDEINRLTELLPTSIIKK